MEMRPTPGTAESIQGLGRSSEPTPALDDDIHTEGSANLGPADSTLGGPFEAAPALENGSVRSSGSNTTQNSEPTPQQDESATTGSIPSVDADNQPAASAGSRYHSYFHRVQLGPELLKQEPRLRFLSYKRYVDYHGRRGEPKFDILDFKPAVTTSTRFELLPEDPQAGSSFEQRLKTRRSNAKYRVILVEDLSGPTMETLGMLFDLEPDFFADHIAQSCDETFLWNTSFENRTFCNIRWVRPALISDDSQKRMMSSTGYPTNSCGKLYEPALPTWPENSIGDLIAWEGKASFYFLAPDEHDHVGTVVLHLNSFNLAISSPESLASSESLIPLLEIYNTTNLRSTETMHHGPQNEQTTKDLIKDALVSSQSLDDIARTVISITLSIVVRDSLGMMSAMDVQLHRARRKMADRQLFFNSHRELQSTLDHIWEATRSILVSVRECMNLVEATASGTSSTWRFSRIKKTLRTQEWDNKEAQLIHAELVDLRRNTEKFKQDVIEVSNLLISRMSLLESEKQVQESESVTKLTELAFFFVPLAFSATFFGMQVNEFDGGVPLSTWAWTAIGVVLGSYCVRLLLRSRAVNRSRLSIMRSLRRANGLYQEGPVHTMDFLFRISHTTMESLRWAIANPKKALDGIWNKIKPGKMSDLVGSGRREEVGMTRAPRRGRSYASL